MAEFRTAAVFSNHMVLQRDKNIRIFGEGADGERVIIRLSQESGQRECVTETTVTGERWMAELAPQSAGEGFELEVTCGNQRIHFTDIAIGEVWIAGGQSNMELELQNCKEGPEALANDENPNVRFYYTQKRSYLDEQFYEDERKSSWTCFGDPYTGTWSAVGYFFAKKLAKELGVTVGVIGCNWGGTSASCWMDRESLEEDAQLHSYVDEYDEAVKGLSIEEQLRAYDAFEAEHAIWSKKAEECAREDPMMEWDEIQRRCGECKWPGPMNCKNPFRPAGLYECMLKRIMPYTVKGVLWYQGESDDHKPRTYERLLTKMIQVWRRDWMDMSLPFMIVQLPMHRYQQDPDFKNWPIIREAQLHVFQSIRNVGMAVITEYSEYHEIHPKSKKPVGERLELQAMHQVYHRLTADEASGPLYRSSYVLSANSPENKESYGKMHLSFDYAEDGFRVEGAPHGFEIAGADKQFVPAVCEITGNGMEVYAKEVAQPRYVRYCWTNYCVVNIFGAANGIPLAPFRTSMEDDEQQEIQSAEIQQVMEV